MLRRMTDMPAGTIGFEAIGEVEDDDWEDAGRTGAATRDRRGARACGCSTCSGRSRERSRATRWRRTPASARVTRRRSSASPWSATRTGCAPPLRALSFLLPGKAKGFPVRELEAAKAWLTADSGG